MPNQDYFWTDANQATERLAQTYVMHNDRVVYVREIGADANRRPTANAMVISENGKLVNTAEIIPLNDPGFKKFRHLPYLGWCNSTQVNLACFLERRPRRNSRQHGLTDNNVTVRFLSVQPGREFSNRHELSFRHMIADQGYLESSIGNFPPLGDVLKHLREESSVAISPTFAVARKANGLRWLYRRAQRIGLFTDSDSILLLSKFAHTREELMEDNHITVNNIKEF